MLSQNEQQPETTLLTPSSALVIADTSQSDIQMQTIFSQTQTTVLGPTQTTVLGPTQTTVLGPTQTTVLGPTQTTVLSPTRTTVLSQTRTTVSNSQTTAVKQDGQIQLSTFGGSASTITGNSLTVNHNPSPTPPDQGGVSISSDDDVNLIPLIVGLSLGALVLLLLIVVLVVCIVLAARKQRKKKSYTVKGTYMTCALLLIVKVKVIYNTCYSFPGSLSKHIYKTYCKTAEDTENVAETSGRIQHASSVSSLASGEQNNIGGRKQPLYS